MLAKLDQLANRLVELDELLMSEGATANMDTYRKMTREHAELGPLVTLYKSYGDAQGDLVAAQDMLSDPEMKEFAQDEIEAARERLAELELELQKMLLPKDANDERNIFLEIRAGTGGDESALFAGDLLRMYTRFAERNRWQVEVVSESASDLGGYREVIVRLVGNSVYSKLKFESGITATVQAEVWMRPCVSVAGTRCTRWPPDSNFSFEYTLLPTRRTITSR